ncbi:restriction endonuclease subunit S [Belliella kenyensis]|uniref:Restriction endonuclease subunit S n=1 Tax=Belliella kenyensis TaxID=1472724 RepID=A0ABV8EK89_9BACT|nr:restriction endonuclease subunit S [Belliella kenyensis]MCH7400337.1 restriction endonuclease subunit S [Belliella kenyensis]MDN3604645.1 restriction endonuclease subunit S [Belliella kenyensis]
MMEEKLPKGWKISNLFDIAVVTTGRKDANFATEDGQYFFFTCAIEPLKSPSYSFEGEVLLLPGNGANVGQVLYFNGKFEAYQRTYIVGNIKINPRFLYYYFLAFWKKVGVSTQYGSATNYIKIGNFKDFEIINPPLPEQQRIVAKLDALFGHLDSLREKLDRIPALLKNFRQQVLTQAVTGELTKEWRKGKGLGEWEEKSTNDLFEFVTSGSRGWAEYYNPSGNQLFVRITNMNFGRIDLDLRPEKCQYLELPERQEGKRTLIKPRDILISITADVGMIALIEEDFGIEAYVNQHICLARPGIDINEKFLAYYLMSDEGFGQFQSKKRGATKAGLTLGDIRALNIKLPTAEEQAKIVEVINTYLNLADRIESQYASLKAKIDQLPQAVLAKAFRGELVSQEVKEYVVEEIEGLMAAEEQLNYRVKTKT